MKARTIILTILIIIISDQALKIWVKTHMHLGEQITVFNSWFRIYFIENEGMAWGWKFGGEWGKMILTLFRLVAVVFGIFYIRSILKKNYSRGFLICVALIFAGALGNLIDSMFYGLIFEDSEKVALSHIFPPKGYAGFLHGKVVDMLYFPMIEDKILPNWVPIWGGESFTFFSPIFNIADASISIGVIAILLFQKRFFKKESDNETHPTVETNTPANDTVQVS
ncbi:MAG TPA: lipoprotein signal peptidase [Chitinophagaceae bacterium]|nr:lipoprotein signal peptidase [Chitinophagaceae bacterium]